MVVADDELKYYGSGYRSYERIGKVIRGELFLLPDLAIGAAIKRLPYGQVFNKEAIHSALKNADMLVKQGDLIADIRFHAKVLVTRLINRFSSCSLRSFYRIKIY